MSAAPDGNAATRWSLYVVRTGAGELYTGIALDVARRLEEHRAEGPGSKGAKYLRGRGPLELVYARELGDRSTALRAESRLKRRSRGAKQAIVAANPSGPALLSELGVEGRAE